VFGAELGTDGNREKSRLTIKAFPQENGPRLNRVNHCDQPSFSGKN